MCDKEVSTVEKIFTLPEFAATLRISEPTALKMLHMGVIKAGRAGHRWRIAESAITEFLRGGSGSGTDRAKESRPAI